MSEIPQRVYRILPSAEAGEARFCSPLPPDILQDLNSGQKVSGPTRFKGLVSQGTRWGKPEIEITRRPGPGVRFYRLQDNWLVFDSAAENGWWIAELEKRGEILPLNCELGRLSLFHPTEDSLGVWNALRGNQCHFGEPEKLVFREGSGAGQGVFSAPQVASTHLFVSVFEHQINRRPDFLEGWDDLGFPQMCLELGYRGLDFVEVWRSI